MIIVNARFLTQKTTGVQRFAIEISKILSKALTGKVIFITPQNILHRDLANKLGAVTYGRNTGSIWEQVDLKYYLLTNKKPLLINFCNTGVLFYTKQIVTIHDTAYLVNPKWYSKRFYWWYNYLIPNISKYSLKILTVSNASKADLIKYLNIEQGKISVIYNSSSLVSNSIFEPESEEKYFLTVSSIDARKNLPALIEAFSKINRDVKLVIVGLKDTNFAFDLDSKLLNDNIILKGYVNDETLKVLMTNAIAFVYVSLYEGFGLPPIEAMSMGCPVIVSDIAAHKEICADAALYVDPLKVEDIVNAMMCLLVDNEARVKLIEAGKQNIKRFNWPSSAQKIVRIINEIL